MTKGHYQKHAEMLPFEVIAAATQGDTDALCKVLEHYDGYIAKLCTRLVRDEYGNSFPMVDEEMRNRLKIRLIATILRVSKGMIYNLLHTNQLRGFLIGRKYRILKSDLICYLNNTIRSEKKNDTAV